VCESDGAGQGAPPGEQGCGRPLPTSQQGECQPAHPPSGRQQGRLQVSIHGPNKGSKGYVNGQSDDQLLVNANVIVFDVAGVVLE